MNRKVFDWLFRLFKGMLIGTGTILPGVSGGALAAVFGFYEHLISFIANITKDFKKNLLFFMPVGLGGVFGVFLLSYALSYFFENAETQILWFFVGCIVGIIPSLIKQAAKKGREPRHYIIVILSAAALLVILKRSEGISASLPLNFFTWILAGAIFGLGLIVPGLSPSNFLIYLNLYKPMTEGIKNLDLSVILPLGLGGLITIVTLSKLMNFIFNKAYAGLFHFILGVVFASTIMIIPTDFNYLSLGSIVCALACAAGVALGLFMSKLEDTYVPE